MCAADCGVPVKIGGQLWESVLSFHRVGSGGEIQVVSLGGRCPPPLSHLANNE